MVKFGQYLKHNIVPEWRDKVGGWIRMKRSVYQLQGIEEDYQANQ